MIVKHILDSSDEDSEPNLEGAPIGDFSAHDLIRNRVGEPELFDETVPVKTDNEIMVIAPDRPLANVQSRWSLSNLNPLAFFGTESVQSNEPNEQNLRTESLDLEQPNMVTKPKHTSTPTEK